MSNDQSQLVEGIKSVLKGLLDNINSNPDPNNMLKQVETQIEETKQKIKNNFFSIRRALVGYW